MSQHNKEDTTAINPEFIAVVRSYIPPDRIYTSKEDCWPYGYDYSQRHILPKAVIFAKSTNDVAHVVQACNQFNIPIVGRGGATNATGASVPDTTGIVLSFEKMNQIIACNLEDRYVTVQPGLINNDLQQYLEAKGFFWATAPTSSSYSTIGGNLACNAAGPRSLKYGTTRENVLSLTAVTGNGEVIHTGSSTSKSTVGYDLTRLLIGSEGTLALITEAKLKICPQPIQIATFTLTFANMADTAKATREIMTSSTCPYSLELMDDQCVKLLKQQFPELSIHPDASAILIVEVDGTNDTINEKIKSILDVVTVDIVEYNIADNAESKNNIWKLRKSLPAALKNIAPKKLNEDIVVPISMLERYIQETKNIAKEFQIPIVNFGHAGNGNLHTNLLFNPDDANEKVRAQKCLDAVFTMVVELQGSISGEHGIGLEKKPFLPKEVPQLNIKIMKEIKKVFDNKYILNPGKIF